MNRKLGCLLMSVFAAGCTTVGASPGQGPVGAPIIGIPLGGNMFQPVTGGEPIIGIPTGP